MGPGGIPPPPVLPAHKYGNTKLETPVPVGSLKLSNLGHG